MRNRANVAKKSAVRDMLRNHTKRSCDSVQECTWYSGDGLEGCE